MGGKPGGRPVDTWFLRGGLAFVFAYAATSVVTDPTQFDSYLPGFVPDRWVEPSLVGVAAFELLLVLGLATGRCLYAVSMASAAMLGGVVVLNLDSFDVVFRNVAIVTAALALAVQARRRAWDTRAEPQAVA
ncbi:MAG TPA: MauE/DoxX family redox-associated membrane protein, partial [Acidimicrobiales bacterium]|nr:MauE/DoxX family redox-associated membrane protein [Acidimicrobiales bacterium]